MLVCLFIDEEKRCVKMVAFCSRGPRSCSASNDSLLSADVHNSDNLVTSQRQHSRLTS